MTGSRPAINETTAWARLHQHQRSTRFLHMRDLFDQDPARFENMHETLHGLMLDYSKNRITADTLNLLVELAQAAELPDQIKQMFSGAKINISEDRAVLHTALRLPEGASVFTDGHDVVPDIRRELDRTLAFAETLRDGTCKGVHGDRITDIVNIGIGGSHLGPETATLALKPFHGPLRIHYASNVDGADLAGILAEVNPATTVFIIASKSFSTPETLLNARVAREWFLQQGFAEADITRHFAAVSSATEKAAAFGILPDRVFAMFDWVGGRYSVWSPVGLSVMCAVGSRHFRDFLAGAHAMDEHFRHTPLRHNMPVLMGLIGIWYNTFYAAADHAVIPYDHGLRRFPAYLQQLDMESNGKQTDRFGNRLDFDTGAVIWGEEGANCQHAFFQLLHQGSRLVPADFIVPVNYFAGTGTQHEVLVANALAQTEALMRGKTAAEAYGELALADSKTRDMLAPQKVFPGNRPSNTLMLDALTPFNLGMLMALYEHKVFVQGAVWGINSFDQWGVEYGKILAAHIEPELTDTRPVAHDASTNGLIDYFREHYHADHT